MQFVSGITTFVRSNLRQIGALTFLTIGLVATVATIRYTKNVQTQATLGFQDILETAHVSFSPSRVNLPPNSPLNLMLDAKNQTVSFVKVELGFNKDRVKLSGNILPTSKLKTIVRLTAPSQANATSRISIVLGLASEDANRPPTGSFTLATIPFSVNTSLVNQQTPVSFNQANIQIVSKSGRVLPVAAAGAQLTLNPREQPTPTLTPTSRPTPTATPRPTPTPTSTPIGRPTATPTPTMIPTSTPTPATPSQPTPTPTSRPPAPTPTLTPASKPADLNRDGSVDISDYNILVSDFGKSGSVGFVPSDIDRNGKVDIFDYNILVENFGK